MGDDAHVEAMFELHLHDVGLDEDLTARPVELLDYIAAIERCTGRKATMNLLPLQPGDVPDTMADVAALEADTGYRPATTVETGVARFVEWYRSYHGV